MCGGLNELVLEVSGQYVRVWLSYSYLKSKVVGGGAFFFAKIKDQLGQSITSSTAFCNLFEGQLSFRIQAATNLTVAMLVTGLFFQMKYC